MSKNPQKFDNPTFKYNLDFHDDIRKYHAEYILKLIRLEYESRGKLDLMFMGSIFYGKQLKEYIFNFYNFYNFYNKYKFNYEIDNAYVDIIIHRYNVYSDIDIDSFYRIYLYDFILESMSDEFKIISNDESIHCMYALEHTHNEWSIHCMYALENGLISINNI